MQHGGHCTMTTWPGHLMMTCDDNNEVTTTCTKMATRWHGTMTTQQWHDQDTWWGDDEGSGPPTISSRSQHHNAQMVMRLTAHHCLSIPLPFSIPFLLHPPLLFYIHLPFSIPLLLNILLPLKIKGSEIILCSYQIHLNYICEDLNVSRNSENYSALHNALQHKFFQIIFDYICSGLRCHN